jgi:hypothetical protein
MVLYRDEATGMGTLIRRSGRASASRNRICAAVTPWPGGGPLDATQNVKCYEQTQHLVENKEPHFGEPSNCLQNIRLL